ncbi:MAG: energy transducer TonB [Flavobacteriales bacterium]
MQHASFKALILVFVISALAPKAMAQPSDRQYLSEVLAMTSKNKASYYRVVQGKDGDLFVGKTFSLDGKLKAEGRYKDAALTLEHGPFTFYHANGKVESQGEYDMGNKSGVWLRFDQRGRPLAEKIYNPEPLANIVYTRAGTMPRYRAGGDRELVRYIRQNVKPIAGEKLKGTITTSFIVEKDGALTDVKVVDGKSENIDQQVVQAIMASAPWEPGAERGQPVRVLMRVPVQF